MLAALVQRAAPPAISVTDAMILFREEPGRAEGLDGKPRKRLEFFWRLPVAIVAVFPPRLPAQSVLLRWGFAIKKPRLFRKRGFDPFLMAHPARVGGLHE